MAAPSSLKTRHKQCPENSSNIVGSHHPHPLFNNKMCASLQDLRVCVIVIHRNCQDFKLCWETWKVNDRWGLLSWQGSSLLAEYHDMRPGKKKRWQSSLFLHINIIWKEAFRCEVTWDVLRLTLSSGLPIDAKKKGKKKSLRSCNTQIKLGLIPLMQTALVTPQRLERWKAFILGVASSEHQLDNFIRNFTFPVYCWGAQTVMTLYLNKHFKYTICFHTLIIYPSSQEHQTNYLQYYTSTFTMLQCARAKSWKGHLKIQVKNTAQLSTCVGTQVRRRRLMAFLMSEDSFGAKSSYTNWNGALFFELCLKRS